MYRCRRIAQQPLRLRSTRQKARVVQARQLKGGRGICLSRLERDPQLRPNRILDLIRLSPSVLPHSGAFCCSAFVNVRQHYGPFWAVLFFWEFLDWQPDAAAVLAAAVPAAVVPAAQPMMWQREPTL